MPSSSTCEGDGCGVNALLTLVLRPMRSSHSSFSRQISSRERACEAICELSQNGLMKDYQRFCSPLQANPKLPHACAAISPSLTTKGRLETYFRKKFSHLDGTHLLGVHFCRNCSSSSSGIHNVSFLGHPRASPSPLLASGSNRHRRRLLS